MTKKCASPKASLASAWRKFSSVQTLRQGQSISQWCHEMQSSREKACRPVRLLFGMMTGQKYSHGILLPHVVPIVQAQKLTFNKTTPHLISQGLLFSFWKTMECYAHSALTNSLTRPLTNRTRVESTRPTHARSLPSTWVPSSLNVLRLHLIEQWKQIDQRQIDELCNSMPQRLVACVTSGGHT